MSQTPRTASDGELNALAGVRVLSGRAVVVAMVAFALAMVGGLFTYWELYTRPFRPLQAAIAQRYPGSSPAAIGGRHKSHLDRHPTMLRMVVRIPWDPREETAEARAMANELVEIARKTLALDPYERIQIRLMHRRPEQWSILWALEAPREEFPLPLTGPLPDSVQTEVLEGEEGT